MDGDGWKMGNDVKIKNKRLLLDSDAFFVGEPQSDPTHPSSWSIILVSGLIESRVNDLQIISLMHLEGIPLV